MEGERPAAGVIIVGGGFSGTMLAAQLARRGIGSIIIEGSGRTGRGTAYSTSEDAHLLNVVAGCMGAWADNPGDFAEAVAAEGYTPDDFVPRRRYGEYLRGILDEARASGLVSVVGGTAISVKRTSNGWTVELAGGAQVEGQALVLAQGNQPPQTPSFAVGVPADLFVNDPWSDEGREAIAEVATNGGDVLVIGTGLTMVDVVLSLDEAGHCRRIVALSRRGQVPRAHAPHDAVPVTLDEVPQGRVTSFWRWLRRRGAEVGWRTAVDSIRPHSQALWQALSEPEQRRFMRHARPWWDAHRHRIASEVAARIRHMVQDGRLQIVAGRVKEIRAGNAGLEVSIQRRGETTPPKEGSFALAVNCTGPLGSIMDSSDGVLRSLIDAGLARPDVLGLGLEVDGKGRIAGADHTWALGPLTKGRFWEITAVPDIRGQVAAVADDIAEEVSK
jgi:uncharacterized NAD(P)/FAD-binding protein YdhS